jgi:2-polyprenyl-3-methyl-5-hydroxy-6-metoxy-1,4-benzoquinol methylase
MTKEHQKWFQSWFNTHYYHILYKNRDIKEAELFISNLTYYLNLVPEKDHILDLACGQGRHSKYLNSLGYKVTGIDLSEKSIKNANKYSSESLNFEVHDMRNVYHNKYEVVLNLFTSFGYFEDDNDNLRVVETIKASLNPNGIGVIDFMNSPKVIKNLIAKNTYVSNKIIFNLNRDYSNGFVNKHIEVLDQKKIFKYKERVRAYTFEDFRLMLSNAGLDLIDCFGSYNLEPYKKEDSDRLILIFINND